MIDYYLAEGFNYFDTAHVYIGGQSETALRDCLVKRYPREKFVFTNKLSTHCFNCSSNNGRITTGNADYYYASVYTKYNGNEFVP